MQTKRTQESITNPRSHRGNQAQNIRQLEPTHVGCYSIKRTSLVRLIATLALLLLGIEAKVLGYPPKHGPFAAGHEPTAVALEKFKPVRETKATGEDVVGAVQTYRMPAAGKGQGIITLALGGTTNGWGIDLRDAHGKNLMAAPGTNSMTSDGVEVYACELNGDGQPDLIVNVWSGGSGLAAEGSEVTFLLSGKEGYRATSFYLYDFGKQDLVQFKTNGPVFFIANDLFSNDDEKTRDGRDHNFWVYQLHRIDGNRLVPADAQQVGFPKWVWFSTKDNHDETTQLTKEQKNRLLMKRNSSR